MSRSFVSRAMKLTALFAAVAGVVTLSGAPASATLPRDRTLEIHGTLKTGPGVLAREGFFTVENYSASTLRDMPAAELDGRKEEASSRFFATAFLPFSHGPFSVQANFRYRLYTEDGEPTPYWVFAYFQTPK